MISSKAVGSMTLVIIVLASTYVLAATQTASELYGRGVHAYFAGDYATAIASLSEAIKKNPNDPRPYYFRGLALASRDGLDAGLPDLAKGADVEVNRTDNRLYDVNGALQRVQGHLRLALEKERSAARLAAAERKRKQDRIKYERLKRREDVVLFNPDRPVKKIDLKLPPIDLGDQDPFISGVAITGGKVVKVAAPAPVAPTKVTTDQPASKSDRDPFASPPKNTSPAKQPENPFGDMTPAKKEAPEPTDPFGGPISTAKPPLTPEKEPAAPSKSIPPASPKKKSVPDEDPFK